MIGLLFISFLLPDVASAQIQVPFSNKKQNTISDFELNSFQLQKDSVSPWKGYATQMVGSVVGYSVGGMVASVFMVGYVMSAFGEGQWVAPFGFGLIATGVASPFLAGYFIHRFGKKYHPNGKLASAVLGSYMGSLVSIGIFALQQDGSYASQYLSLANFIIIPTLTGVLFYNLFPQARLSNIGIALVNTSHGKFRPGFPALSIVPNPFIQGTYNTQIRLLSIKF